MHSIKFLDMNTEAGRAEAAAYDAEKARAIKQGQQIYAKIKKSSKYYGQTASGALFPVFLEAEGHGDYKVQGGPGGQYRLADVNLFVIGEAGHELRIA